MRLRTFAELAYAAADESALYSAIIPIHTLLQRRGKYCKQIHSNTVYAFVINL